MDDLFNRKFDTSEELIQQARYNYASNGYALLVKDSKKDRYVVLCCDRGGTYRDRRKFSMENDKKVSSTRLVKCPFEIRGKRLEGGFWILELKNAFHNHDPSTEMSGHPLSRCLTPKEIKDIEKMSTAGIQPHHILSSL